MITRNRTRMDFLDKFQKMIEEYNAGAYYVERFFEKLIEFARELDEEEKRAMNGNLTEEELAIFDLLTKPAMELSDKEVQQVKKVAGDILETLKQEKIVLDRRKRQQSRAMVELCIEEVLDHLPRIYTKEMYEEKCDSGLPARIRLLLRGGSECLCPNCMTPCILFHTCCRLLGLGARVPIYA